MPVELELIGYGVTFFYDYLNMKYDLSCQRFTYHFKKDIVKVIQLMVLMHCSHFNKVIQAGRMQWSRFICERYDNFKVASSNGLAHFYVKELTRDHHPDRGDERIRVETAGGYVLELGGVPQLNGQLAIS